MRLRAVLVLACSLAALACSGGDDGDNTGSALEKVAKAQAEAGCAYTACLYGFSPAQTAAGCDTASAVATTKKAVADGRLTFNEGKSAACLAALQKITVNGCFGAGVGDLDKLVDDVLKACDGVLTGKVAAGGACYGSEECAGDGLCDTSANQCPGKCKARGAAGAACTTSSECQDGLDCAGQTCTAPVGLGADCSEASCQTGLVCVEDVCQQPGSTGAVCGGDEDCASGLYCKFDSDEDATGTCTAKKKTGDSCLDNPECPNTDACLYPTVQSNSGTCTKKSGTGGLCNIPGIFLGIESADCAGRQVCVGFSLDEEGNFASWGTCQPPQDVGGSCTPLDANTPGYFLTTGCFADLVCNPATKKCELPPAAGQACIEGSCGAGAYCDNNDRCQAEKAVGQTCKSDSECASGDCGNDRKCAAEAASNECIAPK